MSKKDEWTPRLGPLLAPSSDPAGLEEFLLANSNLPGPAANLTLAYAFGDHFLRTASTPGQRDTMVRWLETDPAESPINPPREFRPFCALQALGAGYFTAGEEERGETVRFVRKAAGDPRWRVREGAAMALQRIGEADFGLLEGILSQWLRDASTLEQRAIIAGLAHPPFLATAERVRWCLEVSDGVLRGLASIPAEGRKNEDLRVLRQGLEYALSVFVAGLPEEGFAFLRRWAEADDPDIRRVVKANLARTRLAKKYPREVGELLALL